jgi:hypothetical protein
MRILHFHPSLEKKIKFMRNIFLKKNKLVKELFEILFSSKKLSSLNLSIILHKYVLKALFPIIVLPIVKNNIFGAKFCFNYLPHPKYHKST